MRTFAPKKSEFVTERHRAIFRKNLPAPLASIPAVHGDSAVLHRKANCACGGGCRSCEQKATLGIQTKLAISSPDDQFEREADSVADHVMRIPDSSPQSSVSATKSIVGEKPRRRRQTNSAIDGSEVVADSDVPPGVGMALDVASRNYFEPRFGHDFGGVRIHADRRAAELARSVSARAYTLGRDIVFAMGEYAPGTVQGKRLLAHELAHVVQQRPGIQRQATSSPPPPPPAFSGCSPSARRVVSASVGLARRYILAAMGALENPPAPNTPYAEALATHFLNPTDQQRRRIRRLYDRIIRSTGLSGQNFTCAPDPGCQTTLRPQAFWRPSDDLIHICPRFFGQRGDSTCTAIILIHELAHDFGVDLSGTHVSNRGSAHYPVAGAGPPTRPMTAAGRMLDPDPYGFFAAHIANGVDTQGDCF